MDNLDLIEKRVMNFCKQRAELKKYELTPELIFLHLSEEFGEVARQLTNKNIKPEKYDVENFKEEIVDLFLNTVILGNLIGVDFAKDTNLKLDKVYKKFGFKE